MIYVIIGPSGAGKTTLLKIAKKHRPEISIHMKMVSRKKRLDDIDIKSSSVDFVDNEVFDANKYYVYSLYGNTYGIEKKQLDDALKKNIPHLVVCTDIPTIEKLKEVYGNQLQTVFVFSEGKDISQILFDRGTPEAEQISRFTYSEYIMGLFKENKITFDHVIFNCGNQEDLWYKLEKIISFNN